ncbi:hypothetical protein QTJ16_001568 [Diplocarpon rosae]|uniref:Uncharacterized protein n=1 Tax=Diplocarpon rosae TaxID=946125 RepID=A0AAD9T317_9HELO|nr:hypothetical protein QTJ16_001568 [Diplocarpon rosae]
MAAPQPRDIYYGLSLELQTSSGNDPNHVFGPAPVELNRLSHLGGANGVSVSKIIIDANVHPNIPNVNLVECRAYKDNAGTQPGSAVFSVKTPAEISTNLDTVSSVLYHSSPVSFAATLAWTLHSRVK